MQRIVVWQFSAKSKIFAQVWPDEEIVQRSVAQLSWRLNIYLNGKVHFLQSRRLKTNWRKMKEYEILQKQKAMTKENTTTKKPCLRFPEFSGEWEEKRLGDCVQYEQPQPYLVSSENYSKNGIPVLTAGKTFILGYTNETDGIFEDIPIIIFDDFTTDSKYVDFPFKAKSSAMKMLHANDDCDIKFVFEFMQTIKYKSQEHQRHWISLFSKIKIHLPTLAEQRKIASCLSEMDNLIVAQEQKVEALRERKKGLMQQLFPQNGQTVPRLRFPEFSGEWEEKRLGEVAKKISKRNNDLKVTKVLTNSANFGIVDQNAYFDRDIAVKENTSNYYVVEIGEFVYNPRISTAAPVGPISLNKVGQGIMSPLYTIFKFHTGYISFYEQYFQTNIWHPYLKSIANFGARFDRMNITMDGFFNLPILFPSLAEQQKIASCLSELDNLIAAQAKKTETLKIYKKALLQLMFVNY